MQREFAEGPPKGFRKAIPVLVKLDVVIRQEGLCKHCGKKLGQLKDTEFDHVPALQRRGWNPEQEDTIPPANDPEAIEAKHADCHLVKTTGRKGESKLSAFGGDIAEIAKTKRLRKKEEAFRAKLLAKATGEEPEQKPKKKYRWPKQKRPWPKKQKNGGFKK
jgi:nitrate/TMAO reductase-like tetraheme cytochrome c subunit